MIIRQFIVVSFFLQALLSCSGQKINGPKEDVLELTGDKSRQDKDKAASETASLMKQNDKEKDKNKITEHKKGLGKEKEKEKSKFKYSDLESTPMELNQLVDLNVKKVILKNGLTVLLVENKHLPIFSYYTFFKVGSKHERPKMTGVTHFLEHMMFKGTNKYKEDVFNVRIESNGGSSNAYTSMDLTVYHEQMPKEHIGLIIEMEADRMSDVLLAPDSFEKEKNIILEERKLRYENSPQGQLFLEMTSNMYRGTPYEESVIGKIEDIKNYRREDVMVYFKTYYAPNNAILVIVGDIDLKATEEKVRQAYGGIPSSSLHDNRPALQQTAYKMVATEGRQVRKRGQSKNVQFIFAFRGGREGTKDAYVRDILGVLLGLGESSYLVQKYVNGKSPKLTRIAAYNYSMHQGGIFLIGGELLANQKYDNFIREFRAEKKKICLSAVSERSVTKAKNRIFVDYFGQLEVNSGIAQMLGSEEVIFGDFRHYKQDLAIIDAITPQEVMDVCVKVLQEEPGDYFAVWDQF